MTDVSSQQSAPHPPLHVAKTPPSLLASCDSLPPRVDSEKPSSPDSPQPARTHDEHQRLIEGFTILTVAAAFVANLQVNLISMIMNINEATIAPRAINAFFFCGLILDMLAALLAFLTSRWLQRLTEGEKKQLEADFSRCNADLDESTRKSRRTDKRSCFDFVLYTWMGLSLFVPMLLLIIGILCMMAGLYTFVWMYHSTVVAALATLAGGVVLPFFAGDFFIGRGKDRRRKLITRLSEMQGDW